MRRSGACLAFLALVVTAGCGPDRSQPAETTSRLPDGATASGPVAGAESVARCSLPELRGAVGRRSVVFVLADTLRRDRLGAYGGLAHTPRFDALAREGVLFRQAWSQAPWTKPSVATLFTGLYPSQHGVVSHPRLRKEDEERFATSDVLAAEHVTLAEALAGAGWHTAGIVSNPWLSARLGFAQGFEHWDASSAANGSSGLVVSREGLAWLRALPDDGRPFFLYLHYMDPHEPYRAIPEAALAARRTAIEADPRPVSLDAQRQIGRRALDEHGQQVAERGVPANRALVELAYDLGVEAFDRSLGVLLDGLAAEPRAEGAALVVTADHGQALYQRGWGGHGHGLYEDETGVPLLLRWPGLAPGSEVDCPVGLIDLRSTLCDLLAVDCHGADQGHSLLAGGAEERVVLSEGVIEKPGVRAVRDPRYTLIVDPDAGEGTAGGAPPRALFDHLRDPEETSDLLAEAKRAPELAAALARLDRSLATGIAALEVVKPEVAPLDPETRRRLEALGYAGGEPTP